jgi:hypothetical protein
MSRTAFALSLVLALVVESQTWAYTFLNSGFELGAFSDPPGEASISDWRAWGYGDGFFWKATDSAGVEVRNAYTGNVGGPHFGGLAPVEGIMALAAQQVVDVSGTLTTMTPGERRLCWADAARHDGAANLGSAYQVLVNGDVVFGGATGFTPTSSIAYANRESAVFTATGTDLIMFRFMGNPGGDSTTLIDNVTFIPEPTGMVLMITGLIGFAAYARKKRR